MAKVIVSAPGKVILHGEHSVVYGRRAIALSVDLRTKLTVTTDCDRVALALPDVNIDVSWSIDTIRALLKELQSSGGYINRSSMNPVNITSSENDIIRKFLAVPKNEIKTKSLALIAFFHLYFSILSEPLPINVLVESDMPTGAGLGSSAAYAVCLATALLKLTKTPGINSLIHNAVDNADNFPIYDKICKWAYCSEQIVHGSPSGIDNSICTYGRGISFKDGVVTPITVPPIEILLVDTKVPRNTKALVNGVKELHCKYPDIIEPLLTSMDAVAEKALLVLNKLNLSQNDKNDSLLHDSISNLYDELYDLVDINHAQLVALGVSHPRLEKLIGIVKNHHLHAKLTGAGGGGFAYVLLGKEVSRESVLKCRTNLEAEGFRVWSTNLGTTGVTFE